MTATINQAAQALAAVKERPILMNAPMVRATLDGSKTQTRRIMKPQPELRPDGSGRHQWPAIAFQSMVGIEDELQIHAGMAGDCCPHGGKGERLWVRETFAEIDCRLTYRADTDDGAHCKVKRWTPSIHMPRAASRILLEIVSVRVERLNDISEADARAEGCTASGWAPSYSNPDNAGCDESVSAADAFAELWESINGAGSWAANPWVWCISFKRVQP